MKGGWELADDKKMNDPMPNMLDTPAAAKAMVTPGVGAVVRESTRKGVIYDS